MSLKVKVRYFAAARDYAAKSGELLSLDKGASVADLAEAILKLHPSLRRLGDVVRYSLNFELTDRKTRLHEGDEVGVLPPVAGG